MAESFLPPLILELRAKAGEVHQELREVRSEVKEMGHDVDEQSSRSSRSFAGLAGAGKAITFGVAGAAAAIGAFGIEASTTAQVADAKLSTAVRNVGGNMEDLEPKIDATDASMRHWGFTNAATNTALAALTTALHDPTQAMHDMGVVADLARLKNIPLAESAMLVAKASEGQTRPLKALGIDLPVYAGGAQNVKLAQLALAKAQAAANAILTATPGAMNPASKAHAAYQKALAAVQAAQTKLSSVQNSGKTIVTALTERVHGQAEAYSHTLAGSIDIAKAGLDNLGEKVGGFLIPKIVDLIHVTESIVTWFGHHTTIAKILAGVIGGALTVAVAAYAIHLADAAKKSVLDSIEIAKGWLRIGSSSTTAAAEVDAAATSMTASSDTAAAGFAGAAAEVEAAEDSLAATSEVTGVAVDTALGPIGLAMMAVGVVAGLLMSHWRQVWGTIQTVAKTVWNDGLKPIFEGFMKIVHTVWTDAVEPVFGFITKHWGLLFALMTGGLSLLVQHWRDVWTAVKDVWNDVIKPAFDWIKGGAEFLFRVVKFEAHAFAVAWHDVWTAVKDAVRFAWDDVIKPVFGFIEHDAIDPVESAVHLFGRTWDKVWGDIKKAVKDAWDFVSGIFDKIKGGVHTIVGDVSSITSSVSGAIHSGGDFNPLNWDTGGPVPGAIGQPVAGVVHGGEYVLSHDMLNGNQVIDPGVIGAVMRNASRSGGGLEALEGGSNPPTSLSLPSAVTRSAAATGSGGAGAMTSVGMPAMSTIPSGGGSSAGSVRHAADQVIEIHTHLNVDGRELAHVVEREMLRIGLRRGRTYQEFPR